MRLPSLALAVVLLAALAVPGTASAASKYCGESGDVCFGWTKRGGPVRLTLDTFSFTGKVKVCVTGPSTAKATCRNFRLQTRPNGIYGFSAKWRSHFPNQGTGTYVARFSYQGTQIGPAVDLFLRTK